MEWEQTLAEQNEPYIQPEVEDLSIKQHSQPYFSEEVVGGLDYDAQAQKLQDTSTKEKSAIDLFISEMNSKRRTDVPDTYRKTGRKTSHSGTIEFNARLKMQSSDNGNGSFPLTSTPNGKGSSSVNGTLPNGSDAMKERRQRLVILDHNGTRLSQDTVIKLPKVLNKNPPVKREKKKANPHPPHSGDDGSDISPYYTSEEEAKCKTNVEKKTKRSGKNQARKKVGRNLKQTSDEEVKEETTDRQTYKESAIYNFIILFPPLPWRLM